MAVTGHFRIFAGEVYGYVDYKAVADDFSPRAIEFQNPDDGKPWRVQPWDSYEDPQGPLWLFDYCDGKWRSIRELKDIGIERVDNSNAIYLRMYRQTFKEKGICWHCGCTEFTPCITAGIPCRWTDRSQSLCSACDSGKL